MSARIQVVLDSNEKAAFQSAAKKRGMSLSSWIKACVRKEIEEQNKNTTPRTKEELKAFFKECDDLEQGLEPDWEEHKRVIQGSAVSGNSDS
jgi:hypothetical protein